MQMIDEAKMREVAAQLRKPEGAVGLETALHMNESNREMSMAAIRALDAQPGELILEIGMGNGEFVKEIVGNNASIHYTGLDYSTTMIEEASRRNKQYIEGGQVKFSFGDANDLPFDDHSFDKAIGVNTIYFWEPEQELRELHRVLRPQGRLVFGIRVKDLMRDYPFTKYGFTLYSSDELRSVLTGNGFKVISVTEHEESPIEIDGHVVMKRTTVAVAEPIK
jgi:SAM-dependent methyltransferase